jgi:MerR family copper efflux transcriptional regulator
VSYTIGQAARAAGVTARAVRLYESKGLVAPAERSPSGYRVFTDEHVETLAFIRQGRRLGLSLDAITEIMDVAEHGTPCDRTRALLAERLVQIDRALADLHALRQSIERAAKAEVDASHTRRCALIEAAEPGPTMRQSAS